LQHRGRRRWTLRVCSGSTGAVLRTLDLGTEARQGGVRVACADVNGDGLADLIAGSGPGVRARVASSTAATGAEIYDYFAAPPGYWGGLNLTAGDVTGDGLADIIAGSGSGAAWVRVFSGADSRAVATLQGPASGYTGGVRVGVVDADGDGLLDIAAAQGPSGGLVRFLDGRSLTCWTRWRLTVAGSTRDCSWRGRPSGRGISAAAVLPTVTINRQPARHAGGSQRTGEFTISRTGDTSQALNVSVLASGTATAGTDYTSAITGLTVTIPMDRPRCRCR